MALGVGYDNLFLFSCFYIYIFKCLANCVPFSIKLQMKILMWIKLQKVTPMRTKSTVFYD